MTSTLLVGTAVDSLVARTVLAIDLGVGPDDPRTETVLDFVDERVQGAATSVRVTARLAAGLLSPVVLVTTGRHDDRAALTRLGTVLRTIERLSVPGVGDYVRMIRALSLVAWFDGAESRS